MNMLKDYLNEKEIKIASEKLNASIKDVEVYESFAIELTYEDMLEVLYGDRTQEYSEEEFLNKMDNVFKFECGYVIVWQSINQSLEKFVCLINS